MNLDAFVWGAWGAIICAFIVIASQISGASGGNVLLSDPYRAAGGGFLWAVFLWNIREWLIVRRR